MQITSNKFLSAYNYLNIEILASNSSVLLQRGGGNYYVKPLIQKILRGSRKKEQIFKIRILSKDIILNICIFKIKIQVLYLIYLFKILNSINYFRKYNKSNTVQIGWTTRYQVFLDWAKYCLTFRCIPPPMCQIQA